MTTASRTQGWALDALGNFSTQTTDDIAQTSSYNRHDEVASISGTTTPTFDANGNMTGDETGRQFVYDAWNRLVEVKDASGNTLKTYAYDGLHRRISETAGGTTTDLYYSDAWQVLEERVTSGGTAVPPSPVRLVSGLRRCVGAARPRHQRRRHPRRTLVHCSGCQL